MYNTFLPIFNSMLGDETPYEIQINGMILDNDVTYDITISLDSDHPSSNDIVHVFIVEDEIYSYWSSASQWHNARNVARIWEDPNSVNISSSGETETFNGSFTLSDSWVQDNVKIIAIVQNNTTKQILQVSDVYIDDMNPDVDDDGVMNWVDNCPQDYNPSQDDEDNDLIGNECDQCNNNVYVTGNLNGDTDVNGNPVINVFDVLFLVDFILTEESMGCHVDVANMNGDEIINVIDIVTLVQGIMNNTWSGISPGGQPLDGILSVQQNGLEKVATISSVEMISGFQFSIPESYNLNNRLILPEGWSLHSMIKHGRITYLAFDETGTNAIESISFDVASSIHAIDLKDLVVSNEFGQEINMKRLDKTEAISIALASRPEIWNLTPNPFNPVLSISFSIPFDTKGKVAVYNTLGEEVEVLADKSLIQAGDHSFQWDASSDASGMYFIQIQTPNGFDTKKALLLK